MLEFFLYFLVISRILFIKQEREQTIIVPDLSSDDEHSCSSVNDSQLISLDTTKLWLDIAHMIKCIYRETNREFTGEFHE